MITRKVAGWVCSLMLITSLIVLAVGITESITWLTIVSSIATLIYSFALGIVIYDKKQNG